MSDNAKQCANCDRIADDMLLYWHNDESFYFCNRQCAEEWALFCPFEIIVDHKRRRLWDSVFDVCDDAEDYGEEM